MKKYLAMLLAILMMFSTVGALAEETDTSLTIAVGGQFTTLDPGLNTETVNAYLLYHMYAGLFTKDENNAAVKNLCKDYTVSEDGKTWTFQLIDANWSDGQPITANDFVFAYLRAMSYGPENAWAVNTMLDYIVGAEEYSLKALSMGAEFDCTTEDASAVGIKAIDDKTLELQLTKPCPYFDKILTAPIWAPLRADFAPQHDSQWAYEGGYPVTGMYSLAECSENKMALLTKNDAYHNADAVIMENLDFTVMTDQSAQAMAFQKGDIDFALSVSSETALQYQDTPNLWLLADSSNYFLVINSGETGPEWAKNANLRRALALAIDKNVIVEVLGGEALYPVLNGYVPYGLGGNNDDFRKEADADGFTLTYNPDEAKALLAAEGYDASNPLQIVYKYSNNGMHGDVATMLQAMWQAVGIEATFACVESGVFYDQIDNGDFEISRYGMSANNDAMDYLQLWITSKQIVAAVNDPAYDEMVANATQITDAQEYYTELHKIEDYLCEQNAYVIPLFNYNTPVLVQGNISGHALLGGNIDLSAVTVAE